MSAATSFGMTYAALAILFGLLAFGGTKGGEKLIAVVGLAVAFNAAWGGEPLRWVLAIVRGVSIGV